MCAALSARLVDAFASPLVGGQLEHDVDDVREECSHFVGKTDAQLLAHVHADVVVIVDRHSLELGQRALHDPQVAAGRERDLGDARRRSGRCLDDHRDLLLPGLPEVERHRRAGVPDRARPRDLLGRCRCPSAT